MRGMVSVLDSQSFLRTPDEYARFKARSENIQSRIGLDLALMDGENPCEEVSTTCRPVVIDVYSGSPAATGGLMEGDLLVKLNGPLPSDLSCAHVPDLDSFNDGDTVEVEVLRGTETVTATLQAAELEVPLARGRVVHGNIGYLRVDRFGSGAHTASETVLATLTQSGIGAIVVDLRDNPGGYVSTTVDTSGLFLPDLSVVMHLVTRSGEQTLTATGRSQASDPALLPMVVGVDGGSASGSEAFTGAQMDHARATVVGQKTYGKNTGQVAHELENGDGTVIGVLRLTSIRWLTPLRRSVAGGLTPDVPMDLPRCLHPAEMARRAVAPIRPEVSGLAITSTPVNGDAYTPGQTVQVTVTFASPVTVDTTDGTPMLGLTIGGEQRQATYTSSSPSTELAFAYTIAPGESDPNGIAVRADSLVTGGGTIRHPAGLDAALDHEGLDDDDRHAVTDRLPTEIILSVEPDTIRDDAGVTSLNVVASPAPDSGTHPDPLTLSVGLPDDPARYSSTPAQVTIPAGHVSGSGAIVVTPVPDTSGGNHGIAVTGTLAGFTVRSATLTITGNAPPYFTSPSAVRSVDENSGPGTEVGSPITAVDLDGDLLTYTLGGDHGHLFVVDNIGQIRVGAAIALDFEASATYSVALTAADGAASDSIDIAISILDVEEDGTVTLSSTRPEVGKRFVAAVLDPDGGVTGENWTWERSADPQGWEPVGANRSADYTPSADDVGKRLQVTASYTDTRGSGKSATTVSANPVTPRSSPPTIIHPPTATPRRATTPEPPPRQETAPGKEMAPVFDDIAGTVHGENIRRIAAAGITKGCNPPDSDRYCPDRVVTRAQMATFIARALDLPEAARDYFGRRRRDHP